MLDPKFPSQVFQGSRPKTYLLSIYYHGLARQTLLGIIMDNLSFV